MQLQLLSIDCMVILSQSHPLPQAPHARAVLLRKVQPRLRPRLQPNLRLKMSSMLSFVNAPLRLVQGRETETAATGTSVSHAVRGIDSVPLRVQVLGFDVGAIN